MGPLQLYMDNLIIARAWKVDFIPCAGFSPIPSHVYTNLPSGVIPLENSTLYSLKQPAHAFAVQSVDSKGGECE